MVKSKKITSVEHLAIFIAVLSLAMNFTLTLISRVNNINPIVDSIINIILILEAGVLFWLAYRIYKNKPENK